MIKRSAPSKTGVVTLTFTLRPEDLDAELPVSVVGDFNEWNPYTHPMKPRSDGGRRVSVKVPEGKSVCFRYLADGGRWFDDPDADDRDHRGGIVHTHMLGTLAGVL